MKKSSSVFYCPYSFSKAGDKRRNEKNLWQTVKKETAIGKKYSIAHVIIMRIAGSWRDGAQKKLLLLL
jgi:hypothetical protein